MVELTPSPKENLVIIRPSFKKICDKDACRAAIFNHLLYSISGKITNNIDYWYGSLEELHTKGLDESWSMGKMRKELDALVEQGIIGQRHNPIKKWDRTLQYFFGKDQAKKLKAICKKLEIDLTSIGLPSQVMHLLHLTNAFDNNDKWICQICQIDLSNMANPFVKYDRAIPKVTTKVTKTKVTTKVRKKEANASTQSSSQQLSLLSDKSEKKEEEKKPEGLLTSDEQAWFENVYCQAEFIKVVPKVTQSLKTHIPEFMKHAETKEKLNSLYTFTRNQKYLNGKPIYPGNMVNSINDWLQSISSPVQIESNRLPSVANPPAETEQSQADQLSMEEKRAQRRAAQLEERKKKPVFWTTTANKRSEEWETWRFMSFDEATALNWSMRDDLLPYDRDKIIGKQSEIARNRSREVLPA